MSQTAVEKEHSGILLLCDMFVLSPPHSERKGHLYGIVLQVLSLLVIIRFSLRAVIVSTVMERCWNPLEMHRPWVYHGMHICNMIG